MEEEMSDALPIKYQVIGERKKELESFSTDNSGISNYIWLMIFSAIYLTR